MTEGELDPRVEWIARELRRPVRVDPAARARLMEAVRQEPVPIRETGAWRWLRDRRGIRLSPLAALAAAASLVAVGLAMGTSLHRDGRSAGPSNVVVAPPQLPVHDTGVVKFVLVAPQAREVSLVGDFNQWDAKATPMERGQGATWTVALPLAPGRHVYAFVVNGAQWLADPSAPLAPDDGFGVANSVVLVGGPRT